MGNKHQLRKKSGILSKKLLAKKAIQKRWDEKLCPSLHDCSVLLPEPGPSSTNDSEVLEGKSNKRISDFESSQVKIIEDVTAPEYTIIDNSILQSIIESLACPECNFKTLNVNINNCSGFSKKIKINCDNCEKEINSFSSQKVSDDSRTFDINRRVAKAFTTIGKGYGALEQFSLIMNMIPMSNQKFHEYSQYSYSVSKESALVKLELARKNVRKFYKNQDPAITDVSILDLAVSFDGTWHKRGYTSNYGIGCVIELGTGLVIDFVVLSKYCQNCSTTKTQLGENSAEFYFWYQGHINDCQKNYEGSSPSMEVHAAEVLWKRSMNYKFRYTKIISDGDSKVFSHLSELNVYGENVSLLKEECVNHVSKRLGTALRNLVKTCKAKKITLGGKSHGSLKETTIVKLTKYYKNAIAANVNTNVESMKTAILATLHHCVSTDNEPKHSKCPKGAESWCFYNRALAKNEDPGKHYDNIKTPINIKVLQHLAPIYKRMTDAALLQRCLKGYTQNANESLHNCIWRKCEKSKATSKKMVEAAAADGISEYNFGSEFHLSSMKAANLPPGHSSSIMARRRDLRRKRRSLCTRSNKFQERRRKLRLHHIREEELRKEKEGLTYGAGEF